MFGITWINGERDEVQLGADVTVDAVGRHHELTFGAVIAVETSRSAAPAEADLRAAVRAFWDLYVDVGGRTSSLDLATIRTRLAERTTGDELRQLDAFFTTNKNSGFVVRGTVAIAPVILSSTATTAQVRDCNDDRTGLYRADGSRVDTDNPLRHRVLMRAQQRLNPARNCSRRHPGPGGA